jgi:type VI protein secretion system component Hcp
MGDSVEEETTMKSKKATKRLHKSKKLEATKPLQITKFIDKASPKLY